MGLDAQTHDDEPKKTKVMSTSTDFCCYDGPNMFYVFVWELYLGNTIPGQMNKIKKTHTSLSISFGPIL